MPPTHPTAVAPPASGRPPADRWFRVHRSRAPRPARRLLCFPHAGGTAQLFHGWPAHLPDDVELLAVRYPGRRDRLREPCITDMTTLADAVTEALAPLTDLPLTLFGHSMGSAVAYEVAVRLDARGRHPERLLVSGRAAPHRARPAPVPDGDDDALLATVRGLGAPRALVPRRPLLPRRARGGPRGRRRRPPHPLETPVLNTTPPVTRRPPLSRLPCEITLRTLLHRHPDLCFAEGPRSPRRTVVPGTPPRLPRPAVRV